MRSFTIFSFLLFGIALSGFSQQTIQGDGSDVTVTRSISSFDHLHNSISAQVTVTKGDKYEVRIEGEANVVAVLLTEVKDGELDIHFPSFKNIRTTRSLRVFVTTPGNLSEVSNSGSGGIRTESVFKTGEMRVHNSGSGGIAIELAADHLDMSMSGSGNIQVKGSANQLECNVSGSGSIRASDLTIKEHSEINVSGSGSCNITTDGIIDGHISGSGGINYSGNPSQVNVSHSGSGRAYKV